jgi:hypothetical protein
MVLQPSQARVCSGFQSLETSSRGTQPESDIAKLNKAPGYRQQIGLTTDLLANAWRSLLSGLDGCCERRRRKHWRCRVQLRMVEDQP